MFQSKNKFFFRAYGSVFLAKLNKSGKLVAVKQVIVENKNVEILVNEIVIMKNIKHKHIVNFVDAYVVSRILWVWKEKKKKRTVIIHTFDFRL